MVLLVLALYLSSWTHGHGEEFWALHGVVHIHARYQDEKRVYIIEYLWVLGVKHPYLCMQLSA